MSKSKTAKVWTLGNTTVRNPYRILGALRVFKKYFNNSKSFSSNISAQGDFFDKILTSTDSGEPYNSEKPSNLPIYSFIGNGKSLNLPSKDYKEKNGRLWLSPMDSFGFISAYGKNNSLVCNPGKLYIDCPELEGDIWLRQLVKFQYPNNKSEISNGGYLRPALVIFKLMVELEGLSKFELGLSHLIRSEDISYLKSLIKDYRKLRIPGTIEELKERTLKRAIEKHFSDEISLKLKFLKKVFDSNSNSEDEINSVLSLGKGHKTKRALFCKSQIMNELTKDKMDFEVISNFFLNYYFKVKKDTISKDYPDLTKRYLSMSGILQQSRSASGETRLNIDPRYLIIIKNLIKNIGDLHKVVSDEEKENYLNYLRDSNKPHLLVDDPKYVTNELTKMKNELTKLNHRVPISCEKYRKNIRIYYNLLRRELNLALETEYMNQLKYENIKRLLLEITDSFAGGRYLSPTDLESYTWDSLLYIGGFNVHPSQTRNFHVDTNFRSIFTAAGNQPDMQFPYEKFNLIVEVTKSKGKTQWRAEAEPVTRHIAVHAYTSKKQTIGLFIAPEINEDTAEEFFRKSNGEPVIVNNLAEEVRINILPLTYTQYKKLFDSFGEENRFEIWMKKIEELSKICTVSKNPAVWMKKIEEEIQDGQDKSQRIFK
jgi:hypothetical protein